MAFVREALQAKNHHKISISSLKSFTLHKGNSKLGDSLVNFIYSLAKTRVLNSSTGTKVSDYILSEAYKASKWKKKALINLRGNKGQLADKVEALILYFWIFELFTIDDFVTKLMENLDNTQLHHSKEEEKNAIVAFSSLLDLLLAKFLDVIQPDT
ncbi:MAG: ribonuclease III family protein [Candidatus Hodarchaeales archaeon]|jgi:hypothetical protein